MPEITHEIRIAAPPERVYQALASGNGLAAWYTHDVAGMGSVGSDWHFRFAGRPDFRWRIVAAEPGRHVAWRCVEGPGDAVGTTVDYELTTTDDGRTRLVCTHAGWPGTLGNFRKCNTLWGGLLHHLKDYVETGVPRPTFA